MLTCVREISPPLCLQPHMQGCCRRLRPQGWQRLLQGKRDPYGQGPPCFTPSSNAAQAWCRLNTSPELQGRAWHTGRGCFVGHVAFCQDTKTLIFSFAATLATYTMWDWANGTAGQIFPPWCTKIEAPHATTTHPASHTASPTTLTGGKGSKLLTVSLPSHFGSQQSSLPKPGKLGSANGCQKVTLLLGGTGRKVCCCPCGDAESSCCGSLWTTPRPRTGSSRDVHGRHLPKPSRNTTKPSKCNSNLAAPKDTWWGWTVQAVTSSLQVGGTLNSR